MYIRKLNYPYQHDINYSLAQNQYQEGFVERSYPEKISYNIPANRTLNIEHTCSNSYYPLRDRGLSPVDHYYRTGSSFNPQYRNDSIERQESNQYLKDQQSLPRLSKNYFVGTKDKMNFRSPQTRNIFNTREERDYNNKSYGLKEKKNLREIDELDMPQNPYENEYRNTYEGRFIPSLNITEKSPNLYLINPNKKKDSPQLIDKHGMTYVQNHSGGTVILNRNISPNKSFEEINSTSSDIERRNSLEAKINYSSYNNLHTSNCSGIANNRYARQTINNLNVINENDFSKRDEIHDKYYNRTYANMTYADVKKIVRRFTKLYDPNKNTNGLLLEDFQITLPGATDDVFNNRFRVLAKMRRLSNILLSKRRRSVKKVKKLIPSYMENSSLYSNSVDDRSFNRHNLERHGISSLKIKLRKSPENKFKYVSLAMLSSKGIKSEDRIIYRKMRFEKGGVVDLAQEDKNKKIKYKIRKVSRSPGICRNSINPKYREKAAKLIQAWWKEIKNIYRKRLKYIILIQSVYRGRFVRKYMFDLLYLNYLYLSFCLRIEKVMKEKLLPEAFVKLQRAGGLYEQDYLLLSNIMASKAKKWKIIHMRNFMDKIKSYLKKKDTLVLALFRLLRIRAENEKLHHVLREALRRWKYATKIYDLSEKLEMEKKNIKTVVVKETVLKDNEDALKRAKEENTKKLKGLLKILDGSTKIIKREYFNKVAPKLSIYLLKNYLNTLLTKFINDKIRANKLNLRKFFYRFLNNSLKEGNYLLKNETEETINKLKTTEMEFKNLEKERENEMKRKLMNIKARILFRIVETAQNKQNRNILHKKYFQYYQIAMKLANDIEKKDLINKNKEINDLNEKNMKEIVKLSKKISEITFEKNKEIGKLKDLDEKLKELQKKLRESELENINLKNRNPEKVIVEKIVEKKVEKENPINKENEKLAIERQKMIDKLTKEKIDIINKIKKIEEENEKYKKIKTDLINRYKGIQLFTKYLRRKNYNLMLDVFKKNEKNISSKKNLLKLLKIKAKIRKYFLKKYLNKWRNNTLLKRGKEKNNKLFVKILSVIIFHLLKNNLRKKLYQWYRKALNKPEPTISDKDDILKVIKIFFNLKDNIKKKYLKQIGQNFFDKIKKTRNPDYLKKLLKKIVLKKTLRNKNKLRHAFILWRINANNGRNIVLLRGKILFTVGDKYKNNYKKLLNQYLHRWKTNILFNKFEDKYKKMSDLFKNKNKIFLKTLIKNIDKNNKLKILKKYLNKWKILLNENKKVIPKIVIQVTKKAIIKNGEKFLSNLKTISNIDKRNDLLKKLIPKKMKQNKLLLYHYLLRWKNKILEIRASTAYLPYRNLVLGILLTKNDKINLLRTFLKWRYNKKVLEKSKKTMDLAIKLLKNFSMKKPFINFYKKMRETNPVILKPKGKKLIKALEKIILVLPYEKLIKRLKLYARTKKLKELLPKIESIVRLYYLDKYLNRWKNNVEKITDKKLKVIGNWIKKSSENFIMKKNKRKNELLKHFINNIIKDNKYKIKFTLLCWKKITGILTDNDNARIIQDFSRFVLLKIKYRNKQKINKLFDLLQRYFRKNMIHQITETSTLTLVNEFLNQKKEDRNRLRNLFEYMDEKNKQLLKYQTLKIWLNRNTIYDNKLKIIQNAIRIILARKKMDNIKKLKNILLKLFKTRELKEINLCRYMLLRWLTIVNKIECYNNAVIIQEFIRKKMNVVKKNKDNAIIVMNKVFEENILRCVFNSIKKKHKKEKIKVKLIKEIIELEDKNNQLFLEKYFKKWRDIILGLHDKENNAATIIQKNYLRYIMRKKIKNVLKRNNILKNLINKHDQNNLLRCSFACWKRIAKKITCDENALIIQKFCRKIMSKIESNRIQNNNDAYKNLVNILTKIGKIPRNNVMEKIKIEYRNNILDELLNNLNNNKLDKLRNAKDKIENYGKLKQLYYILRIPEALKFRILKNILNTWRDKAMRRKNIDLYLLKFFDTKDNSTNDLLKFALYKWIKNIKRGDLKINSNIIMEFCKKLLEKVKIDKNWENLSNKLNKKNKKKEIAEILKLLKIIMGIKKLTNTIKNKVDKDTLNKLKRKRDISLFIEIITNNLIRLNDNKNNKLLKKYFNLYKTIVRKINERDNKANKMINILDKYQIKKNVNVLNNVNMIKKLLNIILFIKKKIAFEKIKNFFDKKTKYENLSSSLISTNQELQNKGAKPLLNKIYKIYYHKVLENLTNKLHRLRIEKSKPIKEKFLILLKIYLNKLKDFSYSNKYHQESKPFIKKLTFKINSKQINLNPINYIRNNYLSITPTLVGLLDSLTKNRKQEILSKIKVDSKEKYLCKILKKYIYEKAKPNFSNIIKKLKWLINEMKYAGPQKMKLFRLLRKIYIKKLFIHKEEVKRISKIFYLINLTEFHKKQAKIRWIRQILRKWRFMTFVRNIAKEKMEVMYKNMHLSYLELVNTVFSNSEKEISPSIVKEFERFGNIVGMFENESPYTERKPYCKDVKRRYIFENFENLPKKTKTIIEEEKFKKIEKVEKIVKDEDDDDEQYDYYEDNSNNRDIGKGKKLISGRVKRIKRHGNEYSKDSVDNSRKRKLFQDSGSRLKDSELNIFEENSGRNEQDNENKK